jgi:Sugar-binding N-terminal domain
VKSHNTKDPKSAASSRRTPAFGIVSDDFTGGLLVASYFEEAGIECPVYFEPMVAKEDRPSGGIVVIVTRSRLDPVSEARRQIAVALDALDAMGCDSIGYKVCGTFDSTEQGNIGLAADLIAERYDQVPLLNLFLNHRSDWIPSHLCRTPISSDFYRSRPAYPWV